MTELLQQAIAQIQQLPPDQQDAIATRLLAELQDEQKWETRFAATTDNQWDQMAAMAQQEIAKGETVSAIVFWVCWSPIMSTGIGLAHMMNTMNC